ncbi:MAG: DUF4352 domain-containing protein, partial [Chloroflexota bacterium]|nr:DUF4352 domain-containing protein [Chloroflexota bacterium]
MKTNRWPKSMLLSIGVTLLLGLLLGSGDAATLMTPTTSTLQVATELFAGGFTASPHRQLTASHVTASPSVNGHVRLSAQIAVKNLTTKAFKVKRSEFYLSALGDALGHVTASSGVISDTAGATVSPNATASGALTFDVPVDAVPYITLVDQPGAGESPLTIPLGKATSGSVSVVGASLLTTSTNTIEDDFIRPNQAGWGTSTNTDGVANVAWGMDGTASFANIISNTGNYAWQGVRNAIGIASAGPTTYNGGDSLVE